MFARRNLQRTLSRCRRMIDSTKVGTVSFDLFDTCLVRLSYLPRDVFFLALRKWGGDRSGTLYQARCDAEGELRRQGVSHPTVEDIWRHIGAANGLAEEEWKELMDREIEAESRLISARKAVFDLYARAVQSGKRVIVTSDMYLPGQVIRDLLDRAGFRAPDAVYVSCEQKCSKNDGGLYDILARCEAHGNPRSILHIGDNLIDDWWKARRKGLRSFCLMSTGKRFRNSAPGAGRFLDESFTTADERCLFGFILNACEEDGGLSYRKTGLSLSLFSKAIYFPFLYKASEFLFRSDKVQSNYSEIYFISRDGRQPLEAYKLWQKAFGGGLNPVYLYGSRSFYRPHKDPLQDQRIKAYYQSTLKPKDGRVLIFDIGYRGSVGDISLLMDGCTVDKVYFWEGRGNVARDKELGSMTFSLFGTIGKENEWYSCLEGVLCSPEEATVNDVEYVDGHYIPRHYSPHTTVAREMKEDVSYVQTEGLGLTASYLEFFKSGLIAEAGGKMNGYQCLMDLYLGGRWRSSRRILKNISLTDPQSKAYRRTYSLDRYINRCLWIDNRVLYAAKASLFKVLHAFGRI